MPNVAESRTPAGAVTRRFLVGAAAGTAALAPAAAQAAGEPLIGPPRSVAWLKFNENPYGPSPRAIRAMELAAARGAYYPDSAAPTLIAMIAERHRVEPGQIVLSAGSGEVLNAIALAWGRRGPIVAPDLFFDPPARYGERLGATVVRAPMAADMQIDLGAIAAAAGPGAGLVILCNPNNPTGRLADAAAVRAFCTATAKTTTVLVDEAYNELTDAPDANTMVDLARAGENVIVTRTFSKIYGMAGIRMGYAIASPANAETIRAHVMSTPSGPALAGAIAAYDDLRFLAMAKARIVEAREMVGEAVAKAGLQSLPSQTNFVFVKAPQGAEQLRVAMEAQGVIIRGPYDRYPEWSRVSMGRIEDVARYCAALPRIMDAARRAGP